MIRQKKHNKWFLTITRYKYKITFSKLQNLLSLRPFNLAKIFAFNEMAIHRRFSTILAFNIDLLRKLISGHLANFIFDWLKKILREKSGLNFDLFRGD